ncbi:MAG: hypothetical protein ACRDBY_01085, partial [Cetobacterium sp.]
INKLTNETIEDNKNSINLYHQIDNPEPKGVFDVLIGILSITPTSSILNTNIIKSDVIGGGIKEKYIEINKEYLDGYFDISKYIEKSVQKNGTVVIKVDDEISSKYSEDEILKYVNKFLPIGVLPIVIK